MEAACRFHIDKGDRDMTAFKRAEKRRADTEAAGLQRRGLMSPLAESSRAAHPAAVAEIAFTADIGNSGSNLGR